jgi:hypothetical protein
MNILSLFESFVNHLNEICKNNSFLHELEHNIFNSTNSHAHWDFSDCNYAGGIFAGVKYYFTDFFGVKIDFGSDWNDGNISNFGGGVTFKF